MPEVVSRLWGGDSKVMVSELTQVMRQAEDSPIRDMTSKAIGLMRSGAHYDWRSSGQQVGMPREWDVNRAITETASRAPEGPMLNTVSIVFSNKEATFMNGQVRSMMDREEGVLSAGDHLVTDKSSMVEGEVVAKGTRMVVRRCGRTGAPMGRVSLSGRRAAHGLSSDPIRILVNLDVLFSEKGVIGPEAEKKLKEEAMRSNTQYRAYQMRRMTST